MTLRLTASLIAMTFLAGGVLFAAPASADNSGYRTHRSSVQKRATRITIRKTSTARYDTGYAAGVRAGTSYARGYSDGVAAARTIDPPVVTRPYVVYDTGAYVPPVYPYGTAPAVLGPGYAYEPSLRVVDPVAGAFAAATTVPVAVTTPARAVQGDVGTWARDCAIRYRQFAPSDFDPVSGTFLGNDGDRYYCNCSAGNFASGHEKSPGGDAGASSCGPVDLAQLSMNG